MTTWEFQRLTSAKEDVCEPVAPHGSLATGMSKLEWSRRSWLSITGVAMLGLTYVAGYLCGAFRTEDPRPSGILQATNSANEVTPERKFASQLAASIQDRGELSETEVVVVRRVSAKLPATRVAVSPRRRGDSPAGPTDFSRSILPEPLATGFMRADLNHDQRLELTEFQKFTQDAWGELGGSDVALFERLDLNSDRHLTVGEFQMRFRGAAESWGAEYWGEPDADFPVDPGISTTLWSPSGIIDDRVVFSAAIYRYRELMREYRPGATHIDWGRVPRQAKLDRAKLAARPASPSHSEAAATGTVTSANAAGPVNPLDVIGKATAVVVGGGDDFFTGGGVFISRDGLLLTNHHIIEMMNNGPLLVLTADGQAHEVREIVATCPERDVALLRVEGDDFTAVPVASAAPVQGDSLLMLHHSENRFYTFDRGYVMRHSQVESETWMEISANYAPGGSGCGIFNSQGELIGLVCSISMGDGPSLASGEWGGEGEGDSESAETPGHHQDEGSPEPLDPMSGPLLLVKHAVPWQAINELVTGQ